MIDLESGWEIPEPEDISKPFPVWVNNREGRKLRCAESYNVLRERFRRAGILIAGDTHHD